ncbi:C40 family peptidase [uncultured Amnibacterium sp.]|uniref:C40 family peptidase n=1 Tax=uncultured Amnibacterium sp. TaxID=1631851 RepID=UPI0035CC062E
MPQIRRAGVPGFRASTGRGTAIVGVLVLVLALGFAQPAVAATAATPRSAESAATAQIQRVGAGIIGLQHRADVARHRVALARTEVRSARTAAAQAAETAAALQAQAAAAGALTRDSRHRAGMLAVSLARSDMNSMPAQLMLDSRGADGVLQGLSNLSQLAVQSHAVLTAAEADQQRVTDLRIAAVQTVRDAANRLDSATRSFHRAQRASKAALDAVHAQERLVERLISKLVDLRVAKAQDCRTSADTATVCAVSTAALSADQHSPGARAIRFARKQIGEPYRLGGAGPDVWDCSGLTMGAYASLGIDIGPHSVSAQFLAASGADELVPFAEVQPGDLLFFTAADGDMDHVALYSGDGMMIEAPHPGASVREVPLRFGGLVAQVAHIRG